MMTTDKDLEDLLGQVRLSTTAEQDERILADALAGIDQPAVFSLGTSARILRRHWRLSTAAACVLLLLVVLPFALPPAEEQDSGNVRKTAALTESPENPAAATLGTADASTSHRAVVPAKRSQDLAAGTVASAGEDRTRQTRGLTRRARISGTQHGTEALSTRREDKIGPTREYIARATTAQPEIETASAGHDYQTPPASPVSGGELDGKEILDKLKSFDSAYQAAFTASGKRLGGPRKKWKLTMSDRRIAFEEEAVEIAKADVAKRTRLGRRGGREGKPWLAFRSTFYVGPTAQAKYDWVGRIQRYGPLDPWPENGPGPATAGSLDVVDPDAPTYMLHIKRTLWCLGRGYSRHITGIRDVSRQEDGRLKVAADGLDMALRPGAKWELVIDPDAEYMVRSAILVDNRNRRSSFANSGLKRHGSRCVPEKGECKGGFISASFEFQSASFEADVEFLRRAKATMQPPYLIHTDVHDQRVTPERYIPYDAGKMSPQGRRPGFDLDWEKEAVFDMEEVPASEPKLRAVMGSTLTAAAVRKGKIKIRGREYTALLAQPGTTTGSFDGPDTVLLLTPADNPKHRIQSYEKHLRAIRTVDGKYYKISATPTGDKLTVTPCGDNVGVLQVGAGDREVEKREVMGGVLVSKEAVVPLGNFFYPVPAENPGQRKIPVGDYTVTILVIDFGNVRVSLRPNGQPDFNIKIRKDEPFAISFSAKPRTRFTSPTQTQTFKPGDRVLLRAVMIDPELNLKVRGMADGTQKDRQRTYTYGEGKKFTVYAYPSLGATVVIKDSSGKQVAEGKMPFG